jgi:uncharacterized Zn finger protein
MPWYFDKSPKKKIEIGTGIRGGGKFGTTWWGQQWLNAFNNISDSNRLPRGRTYANNGSVRSIDIQGNEVKAVVIGSNTYKINITIPLFSKEECQKVLNTVLDRPDLLSRLLNRELPQELLELCQAQKVDIFPRQWRHFTASCSCPDYAQPCKHLAAIIYLIANEIDKNPFKVFELHGFDLVGALEKSGISVASEKAAEPIYDADLMEIPSAEVISKPSPTIDWKNIDFTTFGAHTNVLKALLTDSPVFYPAGNFKELILKTQAKIAKGVTKSSGRIAELSKFAYQEVDILEIWLNPEGVFVGFTAWDTEEKELFHTRKFEELINWLAGVPVGRLDGLSPELRGLWLCYRYAEALARTGAMVPQFLRTTNSRYRVRWVPATMDENVALVHAQLSSLLPANLILYKTDSDMLGAVQKDYLNAVASVFLDYFVISYNDLYHLSEPITSLFFKEKAISFDTFVNKEYPASIHLWLSRFFISHKQFVPLLEITEVENEQFNIEVLIENRQEELQLPVPLKAIFEKKAFDATRMDILRDLSNIADFLPTLHQVLSKKGKATLQYAARDFAAVLFQQLPIIRLFGIKLLLPKSLSKIIRPAVTLKLSSSSGAVKKGSLVGLQQMLQYQWQAAIGDQFISVEAFLKMLKTTRGLVKIRGEYVYFDEKETQKLAEQLSNPPQLDGVSLLQIAMSEDYQGTPIEMTPELKALIQSLSETTVLPVPDGLIATLRPYQQRGFSWLYKNMQLGFGSILADDMGLGKTLQVITLLLKLKNEGDLTPQDRVLIVAPTTLLTNWEREIAKFAPQLNTGIFHGSTRDLKQLSQTEIIITTYGATRSDKALLSKEKWLCLVIDEAQNIKNNAAEQTKSVKSIPAQCYIALSGTPVENRLSEYWSIFDYSNKGYLGSMKQFKSDYAIPIEADRDQTVLRRFHKVTAPFVMRRLKTDKSIISDLPDKVEINQYCQLTPQQAALYESVVEKSMRDIEANDGKARNGLVLTLIMALKQICNHPTQYLKKGKSDADLSGKCPLLIDLVTQAFDNDEKVLIFTQFKEMGDILVKVLQAAFDLHIPYLHGGTTRPNRDKMVEDFQQKRSSRLMVLSLKAAGTGLNLTAASQVIHFDLWWNPAVEAQATDRAFRIGQTKNVMAHRFITTATFEERIDKMIQEKKALANLTVATGEQWIGDLSNNELRQLFALGK